ncbi:MAG: pseudouridine synthase [Bacteroidota bacterium]|nr:pseudouridine synthase [Bacteroidota bacterium]
MNKSNTGKRISRTGPGKVQSGERRAESGERRAYGSKPPYKKAGSAFAKAAADNGGERKAYGSKPAYKKTGSTFAKASVDKGERKTYGSKPVYKKTGSTFAKATGDTRTADKGERKTYGSKPAYKKAGSTFAKATADKGRGHGAERSAERGARKTYGSKPAYKKTGSTFAKASVDKGERKTYGSKPPYKKSEGFAVKKKAAYGSSKTFMERSSVKSIRDQEEKPARRSFGDKTDTGKGTFFTKKSEMKGYKPRIKEGEEEFKSSTPGARGKFVKTEASDTFVPKIKSQSRERITENALYAGSEIRLNRYISNAGVSSRREADELIGAGLVTINGDVVTELGTKVKAGDVVKFNGQKLAVEAKVYILLNKPKDAITTSDDPDGRNTVMDLFEGKMKERIFPVGRLDRNTTGVLVLTNDGELANRLTHPKYEINKVYKATLNKNLKSTDLWTLANGVMLEDGMIKPDAIAQSDAKEKNVVGIEIHSGRNRIIHRMFEHLGYSVDKLDRVLYAGLEKGSLKRGAWRELSDKELKALKRMVHLR